MVTAAIDRAYEHSLRNTEKLYRAGVPVIFGTDTPFAFGNFFHSVMNEVRALKLAGLPNEAILRMTTSDAATALGISDRVGTIPMPDRSSERRAIVAGVGLPSAPQAVRRRALHGRARNYQHQAVTRVRSHD